MIELGLGGRTIFPRARPKIARDLRHRLLIDCTRTLILPLGSYKHIPQQPTLRYPALADYHII